jgi:hypothetical protein
MRFETIRMLLFSFPPSPRKRSGVQHIKVCQDGKDWIEQIEKKKKGKLCRGGVIKIRQQGTRESQSLFSN